jgi:hypothetical protein
MSIEVYVEAGKSKVFVSAYDWPGWSRGAKTEELAIEALSEYAERYAPVAKKAGLALPKKPSFTVVDRIKGSGGTDFGVPYEQAPRDSTRITAAKAGRLADLVEAAWSLFDAGVKVAPATLQKGPRGGGRDRDQVVEHVLNAEQAYASKLGLKLKAPSYSDSAEVKAFRHAIVEVLRAAQPPAEKKWPVRYASRRIAWHVLDHLWEIEDKS